jgi:hypothetical protein
MKLSKQVKRFAFHSEKIRSGPATFEQNLDATDYVDTYDKTLSLFVQTAYTVTQTVLPQSPTHELIGLPSVMPSVNHLKHACRATVKECAASNPNCSHTFYGPNNTSVADGVTGTIAVPDLEDSILNCARELCAKYNRQSAKVESILNTMQDLSCTSKATLVEHIQAATAGAAGTSNPYLITNETILLPRSPEGESLRFPTGLLEFAELVRPEERPPPAASTMLGSIMEVD